MDLDRHTLRDRVRARCRELGWSDRRLEEEAQLASGTLSKVFRGGSRTKLDWPKLSSIAAALEVSPASLVEGTNFAQLLRSPPETPESKELAVLRASLDEARAQWSGRTAEVEQAREEIATLRAEVARQQRERVELERERDTAKAAVRFEADKRERAEEMLRSEQRARAAGAVALSTSIAIVEDKKLEIANLKAALSATEQQREEWREFGLGKEQRVGQLEAAYEHLRAEAQRSAQQNANSGAITLLAALGALGFGVALGRSD